MQLGEIIVEQGMQAATANNARGGLEMRASYAYPATRMDRALGPDLNVMDVYRATAAEMERHGITVTKAATVQFGRGVAGLEQEPTRLIR